MNIHEYQAKQVLREAGINVPHGAMITDAAAAKKAASQLPAKVWVVKAQIHAGGRGKGGGVKVVTSLDDVEIEAKKMLGMNLITHQTGPEGKEVQRVYIEEGANISKELYLSLLIDRATAKVTFVASTEGGMDIEEVAKKTPHKIYKICIDPCVGFQTHHALRLAKALNLTGSLIKQGENLFRKLYDLFIQKDASLIEINPLVITSDSQLIPLDAKMNFDSNALYRHPEIVALRDLTEEDPKEIEASKHELNYISLDGSIGCMVNGAGLAMATMDIIKIHGGEPANFLDVGGGATKERVKEAFKIILSDPKVKGVLINIFGGIMRCDIIAQGVVDAAQDMDIHVPLVVRLQGSNVGLGREILANSDLNIISADTLTDAAEKIVEAVKQWVY